jgi:hypothetical protein
MKFSMFSSSLFRTSFHNLFTFEINLDTLVPQYIFDDDVLSFLASIILEQNDRADPSFIGSLLPPTGLPLVPYEDSDDDDDEVVEVQGPITPCSKKRRACKMNEPLEATFLCRSKCLNPDLGRFRDSSSAQEVAVDTTQASPIRADALVHVHDSPLYVVVPVEASSSGHGN